MERFLLFLIQYWGGPTTYSDERGHPPCRMRHAPFVIDPEARDRWLAGDVQRGRRHGRRPGDRRRVAGYFTNAAEAMRNSD